MKKHQDVTAIQMANGPSGKLTAALYGRRSVSGAHRIESAKNKIKMFRHMEQCDFVFGAVSPEGMPILVPRGKQPKPDFASWIKAEEREILDALETATPETWRHLAEGPSPDQASRLDVLALVLMLEFSDTQPSVPLTRSELLDFFCKHGESEPDHKTLAKVISRTGIMLKRDKTGPKAHRKSRQ